MKKIGKKVLNFLKKLGIFVLVTSVIIGILALLYITVDHMFANVFSYIARAVLSNFIVFATIIFLVSKFAIKPNQLLEKAQQDIEKNIKNSELAKTESKEKLSCAQKRMENIDSEVKEILKNSDENAKNAGERILQDANKIAISAKDDTQKAIQNNQHLLKSDIIRRTSNALVEIAKTNIIKELEKNPDLHNKLIDDSIETIILNEQIAEV